MRPPVAALFLIGLVAVWAEEASNSTNVTSEPSTSTNTAPDPASPQNDHESEFADEKLRKGPVLARNQGAVLNQAPTVRKSSRYIRPAEDKSTSGLTPQLQRLLEEKNETPSSIGAPASGYGSSIYQQSSYSGSPETQTAKANNYLGAMTRAFGKGPIRSQFGGYGTNFHNFMGNGGSDMSANQFGMGNTQTQFGSVSGQQNQFGSGGFDATDSSRGGYSQQSTTPNIGYGLAGFPQQGQVGLSSFGSGGDDMSQMNGMMSSMFDNSQSGSAALNTFGLMGTGDRSSGISASGASNMNGGMNMGLSQTGYANNFATGLSSSNQQTGSAGLGINTFNSFGASGNSNQMGSSDGNSNYFGTGDMTGMNGFNGNMDNSNSNTNNNAFSGGMNFGSATSGGNDFSTGSMGSSAYTGNVDYSSGLNGMGAGAMGNMFGAAGNGGSSFNNFGTSTGSDNNMGMNSGLSGTSGMNGMNGMSGLGVGSSSTMNVGMGSTSNSFGSDNSNQFQNTGNGMNSMTGMSGSSGFGTDMSSMNSAGNFGSMTNNNNNNNNNNNFGQFNSMGMGQQQSMGSTGMNGDFSGSMGQQNGAFGMNNMGQQSQMGSQTGMGQQMGASQQQTFGSQFGDGMGSSQSSQNAATSQSQFQGGSAGDNTFGTSQQASSFNSFGVQSSFGNNMNMGNTGASGMDLSSQNSFSSQPQTQIQPQPQNSLYTGLGAQGQNSFNYLGIPNTVAARPQTYLTSQPLPGLVFPSQNVATTDYTGMTFGAASGYPSITGSSYGQQMPGSGISSLSGPRFSSFGSATHGAKSNTYNVIASAPTAEGADQTKSTVYKHGSNVYTTTYSGFDPEQFSGDTKIGDAYSDGYGKADFKNIYATKPEPVKTDGPSNSA